MYISVIIYIYVSHPPKKMLKTIKFLDILLGKWNSTHIFVNFFKKCCLHELCCEKKCYTVHLNCDAWSGFMHGLLCGTEVTLFLGSGIVYFLQSKLCGDLPFIFFVADVILPSVQQESHYCVEL